MKSFIIKRQPKAYQGSKTFKSIAAKTLYIDTLKIAASTYNSLGTVYTEDLYGIVYYFQKTKTGTDADNISKPIWDCLKKILFDDDKRVKLRISGIVDFPLGNMQIIDFTNVDGAVAVDLLDAFDEEDHIVYIECGKLSNSMFKFNWETYGN